MIDAGVSEILAVVMAVTMGTLGVTKTIVGMNCTSVDVGSGAKAKLSLPSTTESNVLPKINALESRARRIPKNA